MEHLPVLIYQPIFGIAIQEVVHTVTGHLSIIGEGEAGIMLSCGTWWGRELDFGLRSGKLFASLLTKGALCMQYSEFR